MTDKEVMQMALDALEQITPDWRTSIDKHEQLNNSIEALRTALAQPEPVTTLFGSLPVYDVPPSEPVACKTCESLARAVMMDQTSHDTRREWVGLTEEEISEIWSIIEMQNDDMHELKKFARTIEAKLKEKNT